jgi:multidrug resistance protein, MATE family
MLTSEQSIKSEGTTADIIKRALPIMLGILIAQINFATNTFFVGQVSTTALAANGVASIYYLVFAMTIVGFCSGAQIVMSRRAGEDDKTALGHALNASVRFGIIFSVACVIVGLILAPILFNNQLHDEYVRQQAIEFIIIRMCGLPFFFLQTLAMQFFLSVGKTKYILACTLLSTLVNIIGDYLFIAGHAGAPVLGLNGAAYASIAAEFSYCLLALIFIVYHKYHHLYQLSFWAKWDKELTSTILKVASPVMIQYFFSIATWELFYIYIEHIGKDSLAISQILRSVFGVVGASSWALASSCNSLVSNFMGQKRFSEIPKLIIRIASMSLLIALISGCLLLLFPQQFLGIYLKDKTLLELAYKPLIIVVIANFLLSISTVVFNAVAGTGNTRMSMFAEFSAIIVYIIYIQIVIEQMRLNLSWAWGSEFFYWLCLFLFSATYLWKGNWKAKEI